MSKTERREDKDLAEMAVEEQVTTDITQLDMDTDELIDWVVGVDEDIKSMEDDDNELGNGLEPNRRHLL